MSYEPSLYSKRFALSEELSPKIAVTSLGSQCIFYGLHISLATFTVYTLGYAGLKSWPKTALLLTTFLTLATATVYVVISLTLAVEILTPSDGLYASSWGLTPFELSLEFLPDMNYACSDAILIWRAYILWTERRWVVVFPAILLCGSIASMFVSVGTACNPALDLLSRMEIRDRSIFSSWVLSFATNVVATGLIGLKAWQYRRTIRQHIESARTDQSSSAPTKVLTILVESGVIYCIYWIALLATNVSFATEKTMALNLRFSGSIIQDLSVQIAGMYPLTIIVIVALRKSVADVLITSQPYLSTFRATSNGRLEGGGGRDHQHHTLSISRAPNLNVSQSGSANSEGSVLGFAPDNDESSRRKSADSNRNGIHQAMALETNSDEKEQEKGFRLAELNGGYGSVGKAV